MPEVKRKLDFEETPLEYASPRVLVNFVRAPIKATPAPVKGAKKGESHRLSVYNPVKRTDSKAPVKSSAPTKQPQTQPANKKAPSIEEKVIAASTVKPRVVPKAKEVPKVVPKKLGIVIRSIFLIQSYSRDRNSK